MYTQAMAGKATPVMLTEQERNELEVWVRKPTMERRLAERARIVLEAATGKTTQEIAHSLKMRRGMVSKWRTRFARQHMDGLMDKPRLGAKVKYGEDMERRILDATGCATPTGSYHLDWRTGGPVSGRRGSKPRVAGPAQARDPSATTEELVYQHRPSVCPEGGRRYRALPVPS